MINKKNIRNYEVSIWTLQDSFITVLKPFNLERIENIQEPNMVLKDDGENTFSFKIPMYISKNGKFEENPIWYTTRNGNIIVDMRKIKVIFNKQQVNEKVYEFIITDITEEHNGYSKICSVNCSSLAFHELGKQGYEIILSGDDYIQECEELKEKSIEIENWPINNINYWIKKVLNNSEWNYLICMDWSLYDGVVRNQDELGNVYSNEEYITNSVIREKVDSWRANNNLRSKQKIYRAPYATSWTYNDDTQKLEPVEIITDFSKLEFLANVEGSNSNRYNLLQTIAESFRVFCRFEYLYDDNYHIIEKRVIFYNNFINEAQGIIDFNYGYNTTQISRVIDSNDLVSKMFVAPLSDSGTYSGQVSISDSAANMMQDNILFNFDYLYKIGTITKEQYLSVSDIQTQLYAQNKIMQEKSDANIELNLELPTLEARLDYLKDLKEEIISNINNSNNLLNEQIGQGKFTETNPYWFTYSKSSNTNLVTISIPEEVRGLDFSSLKLYKKYTNNTVSSQIDATLTKDTNEINFIYTGADLNPTTIFGVFNFNILIPITQATTQWEKKAKTIETELNELETTIRSKKANLEENEQAIKDASNQRKKILANLEKIMGPALREGNWAPEEDYAKYQTQYVHSLANITLINKNNSHFIWDEELFDNEQKLTYNYDINTEYEYLCVSLEELTNNQLTKIKTNERDVYYIYDTEISSATSTTNPNPKIQSNYFALGSDTGCQLAFLKDTSSNPNTIIPILVLVGMEDVSGSSVKNIQDKVKKGARLSIVKYTEGVPSETSIIDNSNLNFINTTNKKIVYPRFFVDVKNLITSNFDNMIFKNGQVLQQYTDYYGLSRGEKYYFTLNPEVIIYDWQATAAEKAYKFYYSLTTAADAIYLDALEILKENSMPKVSYTITPAVIDEYFMSIAYDGLGQIAHINDVELKFENVQGYISEMSLMLDKPWEDTYTIKNYTTKFEDIFSTIVAQTDAMQKNSQIINMATNLIDANGNLKIQFLLNALNDSTVQTSLKQVTSDSLQIALAQNTANLANSIANRIINGEIGLAFPSSQGIDSIQLNSKVGLLIEGALDSDRTKLGLFRVTNGAMGFFKKENDEEVAMLYFDNENGDLALNGTVYAKRGWFGSEDGWIIQGKSVTVNNKTYNGGIIYSANNKAILYAGDTDNNPQIIFYDNDSNEVFNFNGASLSVSGNITAKNGTIGGWNINDSSLYFGNTTPGATTSTLVLSKGITTTNPIGNSSGSKTWMISAGTQFGVTTDGALYANNAVLSGSLTAGSNFSVTNSGIMTAKSGTIGGWNISSTSINSVIPTSVTTESVRHLFSNTSPYTLVISAPLYTADDADQDHSIGMGKWSLAPFIVYNDGRLTATKAKITGAITANTGYIGGTSGWEISRNLISSGTKEEGTADGDVSLSTADFTRKINGTSRTTLRFAIGQYFGVSKSGTLYASNAVLSGSLTSGSNFNVTSSGVMTAKRGTIGGWNISDTSINTAIPDSVTSSTVRHLFSNTSQTALAIGAPVYTSADATSDSPVGTGKWSKAPFRVTSAGKLIASGAKISGSFSAETSNGALIQLNSSVESSLGNYVLPLYIIDDYGELMFLDGTLSISKYLSNKVVSTQITAESISTSEIVIGDIDLSEHAITIWSTNDVLGGIQLIGSSSYLGLRKADDEKWLLALNSSNNFYLSQNTYATLIRGNHIYFSGGSGTNMYRWHFQNFSSTSPAHIIQSDCEEGSGILLFTNISSPPSKGTWTELHVYYCAKSNLPTK